MCAHARHPNTRKCSADGFLPDHFSWGVTLFLKLVGSLFRKYAAVFTASTQKCVGRSLPANRVLALSTTVRLKRSAIPFCSGVYAAVVSWIMPLFLRAVRPPWCSISDLAWIVVS